LVPLAAALASRFALRGGDNFGDSPAPQRQSSTFIDRSFLCNGVVAEFERIMAILGA
jgi:hypothetical protein